MSSSKLAVGIVGLPNVGKSTLFNALLKKQQAYVANFPFATIDPNIGVVPVTDIRLLELAKTVAQIEKMPSLPPQINATVEFVDIAGLIAGASQGAGLGNKFLSHIREVDAIAHVVRAFADPDIIKEGSVDPKADLETVETELKLADLQTLEKQKDPGNTPDREKRAWWAVVTKLKDGVSKGLSARQVELSDDEMVFAQQLSLLSSKPIMVVLNVAETDLVNASNLEESFASQAGLESSQVVAICAKTEAEIAQLGDEDAVAYLADLGVVQSGLERLIVKAFTTLGLMTFLTAGVKEVRAWTIKQGIAAPQAAGVIHTDFEKNFIKADVVGFSDFVLNGGWKANRELGKVRVEGREYVMRDGDVVEFKIGN